MRRTQKHEREVMDFIRQEFGANSMSLEGGGKHSKLRFWYNGKEYSYTIGHLNDSHAFKNLQSQIRNMLVPKKPQPTNLVQNMVEKLSASTATIQTPTLETSKSKTWHLRMAAYANQGKDKGSQVWFMFPKEIKESFSSGYNIERLDDENWKISPGGKKTFREYHNFAKIVYTDYIPTFRTTDAEAIESDGELLVFLSMQKRGAILKHEPETIEDSKMVELEPEMALRLGLVPTPTLIPQQVESPTMENRMREIVRQVREIEAACPYRLMRENGRIFWQAPTIE